ncbi:MAG: DNA cytosine methyltransferase [Phycisphaerales bacterium]
MPNRRTTTKSNGRDPMPKSPTLFDGSGDTSPEGGLNVAGLFAGIGGIEIGLHRHGHRTVQLCEWDESAAAVLRARFPGVPLHDDVQTLKGLPEETDLLAGGFPCQDLSQAGRTKGIKGERSGLVGHVFRLIEAQPLPWVMLENVSFMLQLDKGKALDYLVTQFESMGYMWAYRVVDTRSFGIPQRRQRVIFLASQEHDPRAVLFADEAGEPTPNESPSAYGFYWTEGNRGLGLALDSVPTLKGGSTIGIPSPPAIVMPDDHVVTPEIRDAERLQGFPVDWTKPAEAVGRASLRWKLVGNAVTVDVAAWAGERLKTPGEYAESEPAVIEPGSRWPRAAWNIEKRRDSRYCAAVTDWPRATPIVPIHEFLMFEPKPLSGRAASGFASRLGASSLRRPEGFLEAIEAHRDKMLGSVETA